MNKASATKVESEDEFDKSLESTYTEKSIPAKKVTDIQHVSDDEKQTEQQKLKAVEQERKRIIDSHRSKFKRIGSKKEDNREVVYVRGANGQIVKLVKKKAISQPNQLKETQHFAAVNKIKHIEGQTGIEISKSKEKQIHPKDIPISQSKELSEMNKNDDISPKVVKRNEDESVPSMFSDSDNDDYDPFCEESHCKRQPPIISTKQLLKGIIKDTKQEDDNALADKGLAMAVKLAKQRVPQEVEYGDYEMESDLEENGEEPASKRRKKK